MLDFKENLWLLHMGQPWANFIVVQCELRLSLETLETKKREISPRLNAIITNVWGADQVKDREIIENVWKI